MPKNKKSGLQVAHTIEIWDEPPYLNYLALLISIRIGLDQPDIILSS
jgi:hypothetical protein